MEKENREGQAVAALAPYRFEVALKLQPEGVAVHHEVVKPADQENLYAEVWLEHLRRGQPGLALEDLLLRTLPVGARQDRNRCEGLLVEATGPSGETVSRQFGLDALAPVAARGATRMLQSGTLQPEQNYYFEIIARHTEAAAVGPAEATPDIGGSFTVRRAPLDYLEHPLAPLLAQADAVGSVENWIPIFYSHDVFVRADSCSRCGASKEPPVESGAVILGQLCSCPETGEFFLVATDVIELEETEQSTYTLSFSGGTWGRIQEAVRLRQAQSGRQGTRIIGHAHGHNFYPCMLQGKDCRDCEKRETCPLTSVFVSEQDQLWTRAVFGHHQPWIFCHIFGLDTQGEAVHGQFGIQGGRMEERGYHLIPEIPASLGGGGRHSAPRRRGRRGR